MKKINPNNLDFTKTGDRDKFIDMIRQHLDYKRISNIYQPLRAFIDIYYIGDEQTTLLNMYNSLKFSNDDISNRIILYTLLLKKLNEVCNETEFT